MNNNRLVTKYFKITMSIVFIIAFLLLTLLFYNNEFMTKDFKNNISAVIITHDPAISYHYNVIVIDLNFGNSEELASDLPSGYTNATKTNIGLWNDISNDSEYATILTGISDLISSEENCYMLYCYDSYNSEASTSSIYGNIYMNYDLSYNSGIVNLPFQTLSNYHAHLSGFKNVKNDSALTTTINLNNETKAGTKRCDFYHDGFRQNKKPAPEFVDLLPQYKNRYANLSSTLANRIKAGVCEICGKEHTDIYMHHVKSLKALTGKDVYEQTMLQIRRKSLALCEECFNKCCN